MCVPIITSSLSCKSSHRILLQQLCEKAETYIRKLYYNMNWLDFTEITNITKHNFIFCIVYTMLKKILDETQITFKPCLLLSEYILP